jgi:hypothetical protein
MAKDLGQGREKRSSEEGGHTHRRPSAHLDGMAGQCPRGWPEAARGSLHHGTTSSIAPPACTHTPGSPRRSTAGTTESRRGVEISGDREVILERDPAPDLLGEEAAGKTLWRWKRARRRTTHPRWRRRNSSESAEIARRWRGRLGFAREELGSEREGESERRPYELGRFDRPRPGPDGPVG